MYIKDIYYYIENQNESGLKSYIREITKNYNREKIRTVFTVLNSLLYSNTRSNFDKVEIFNSYQENIDNYIFDLDIIDEYSKTKCPYAFVDDEYIAKAMDYIDNNLHGELTLDILANHVHLSKNYFSNLFSRVTGIRFCRYINKRRIHKAKNLLEDTDYNLDYIADECGYNSQSHFSTTFLKFVGTTPSQYRKSTRAMAQ